jgi:hypothetical protein
MFLKCDDISKGRDAAYHHQNPHLTAAMTTAQGVFETESIAAECQDSRRDPKFRHSRLVTRAQLIPNRNGFSTSTDSSGIPEFRKSTFCFFKRFELSEAVERLERLKRTQGLAPRSA